MNLKKHLIWLLLAVILVPPVSAAPPMREVRVAVAVSPDFKAIPNWKSEFERRLGYASKVFETQLRVKFRLAATADWNIPDDKVNMSELCEDLRSRFPLANLENIDVVIGLTRLTETAGLSMEDYHSIGLARPFSGYLVLRYPMNKLYKIQEETVLVHEMGHLFGAVHTMERGSIMFPIVEKQIPNRFDGDNEQILQQTRNMDFRQGINVLQGPTLQIILNSYMKLIRTEQPADFYYALGIFYLQLGQMENTERAWRQALAVDDDAQVHYDLGILYYKVGKQALAVKELSKAVAGFKSYPSLKEKEFSALTILGKAYLAENNLLAAWSSFKRALSIHPNDLDVQTQLAIVEVKRGNFQEGLQLLLRASHREPNNPTIQTAIGTAYYNMNKFEEAISYFNNALSQLGRKPTNQSLEIYSYLGNSYMKLGKPDQALNFLVEACKADPSVECHKKLGLISFQMGLWDNCIGELAPVVERDKSDPDAYGALGVCLHQKKDLSNAIGVFREGIESSKDNKIQAKFYSNIGQILLGERRYDMAQTEFLAALSKDWSNTEAHMGLATSYRGSGQLTNARDALQNVLRLDSKNSQARMLLTAVEGEISRTKKS